MIEFESSDPVRVTAEDIAFAAQTIGCEPRAVNAVSQVEAPYGGYLPDNRPTILFESHVFHTKTDGQYDAIHSGISTPQWVHNYGPSGAHQYDRLHEAILLDRQAALQSASWGKYQIMGMNFLDAGYDTIEAFVADMVHSEAYQLDAFAAFIQNNPVLQQALIDRNWRVFARYNGSGQVDHYAALIAEAYENS